MSREIVVANQQPLEVAPRNMSVAMLDVIARAASDSNVDVAKMGALLEMQERIMAKQAEAEFNAAMSRLMPRLPRVTKRGKIQYEDKKSGRMVATPFAKYEDIDAVIRPLLFEEGFSLTFGTAASDKAAGLTITARLSHSGGHSRTDSMPLPFDTSGSKNSIQAVGSTMQYGKRYLTTAMLNIITEGEDNDGNITGAITEKQVDTIEDMLHACGMSNEPQRSKFLEVIGFQSVQEIHKAAYPAAVNFLQMKQRKGA